MHESTLNDMITYLEYGTKLHIGVLFFGSYGNERLLLPHQKTIHVCPICDHMKSTSRGVARCFHCKCAAIRKAVRTQKAFGGLCINGVYEYTRPVMVGGDVICIIFIGNILPEKEQSAKLLQSLGTDPSLLDTAEKGFDFEKCDTVGSLLESYIRMLLEAESPGSNSFNPLIENLKNYIEANLEYQIELSMLAKMFHYNEKYLGRLFKQKTGFTIREYINLRRLEYAKNLLSSSDASVLTISMKAGFQNVTYFNRIFKAHFHVTPTEYRNRKNLSLAQS